VIAKLILSVLVASAAACAAAMAATALAIHLRGYTTPDDGLNQLGMFFTFGIPAGIATGVLTFVVMLIMLRPGRPSPLNCTPAHPEAGDHWKDTLPRDGTSGEPDGG
jgi:ABC-type Co2+ transport system permease subunit